MKLKTLMFFAIGMLLLANISFAEDFDVSASISPDSMSVSPYGIASYDIIISNLGEADDVYDIYIDGIDEDWYSLSHDSISVPAGSSKTVYLFITPYCTQPDSFTGTVSIVGKSNFTSAFVLAIVPDHEIKVSLPKRIVSCLCEEDEVSITLENKGSKFDENIVLTLSGNATDIVFLETKSIILEPNEKVELPLTIDPMCDGQESSYVLEIDAKSASSYAQSKASSKIDKLDCYDFEAFYPEQIKSCSNTNATFEVSIKNTGLRQDNFEVSIPYLEYFETLTLNAGQQKTVKIQVKEDEPGSYNIDFSIQSSYVEKQGTVNFIVERCYGVDLILDIEKLFLSPGIGKLTKPLVKNIGAKFDVFDIYSDTPWVSVKPSKLELESNQSENIYVYYSPMYGSEGPFEVGLIVESNNSIDEETVLAEIDGIFENVTTTTFPEIPDINITTTTQAREFQTGVWFIDNLMQDKILFSLIVGFILALMILILLYMFVMR